MLSHFLLTLLAGPVVPVPVPQSVLEALISVTVTTAAGSPSGFELKFSLSNRSPLQTVFLLSGGAAPPLFRIVLIATVNGSPQVLADGVVTRNQVTPGENGQSTLTLQGSDLTAVMDLVDFSGLPYPAMPVEARVAVILAKYAAFGIIPAVIPRLFTDAPSPLERIATQEGTDFAYVNQLAEEAGYVFYIEPGPAPLKSIGYWGPEIKVGPPQPALNLDMDALTNVESLSFAFDATKGNVPVVFIQNQATRFPLPVPIPALNPLQPPLGLVSAPAHRFTMMRDTARLSPLEALSRGLAVASQSQDAVEGKGTLDAVRYGRLLKARGLVGVRGAGMAYDGLYFVKSVTTTVQRGECKQSFVLTRNGLVSITPRIPV